MCTPCVHHVLRACCGPPQSRRHQRQLRVWPAVHAKGAHPTALDHLGKDFLSYREGGPGGAEAGGAGAAED